MESSDNAAIWHQPNCLKHAPFDRRMFSGSTSSILAGVVRTSGPICLLTISFKAL